jgi:Protein of unknown function (DUF1638)
MTDAISRLAPEGLAPEAPFVFDRKAARQAGGVLLIACGALAREIVALVEVNRWPHLDVQCLPAIWHNTPQLIPDGVRGLIRANREHYTKIYVVYGDCGTGGLLDAVLAEEGVERIDGPHCYSFFTGNTEFARTADDDMTVFWLTDYLARHFHTFVWQGLGLDRYPELRDDYFRHYTKVVYLAQTDDPDLNAGAAAAAAQLGLAYERRFTGYGDLATALTATARSSG